MSGPITGVILSGGRGMRMGGVEKGLLDWQGQPLLGHLIEALAPQVDDLLLNVNREHARYAVFGRPLVTDDPCHAGQGPLAGVHAALKAVEAGCVVYVPCDLPGLPADLVSRLVEASAGQTAPLVIAATGRRLHPTVGLIDASFRDALRDSLGRGECSAWRWFATQQARVVDFGEMSVLARNLNTPEDWVLLTGDQRWQSGQ